MFKNYLRTAWRNLINNRLYSFLNIGGLAVGICVCMLIMVYVAHERSYDRFHTNAGRIVYPNLHLQLKQEAILSRFSYATAPVLKAADPGIESYLRMMEVDKAKAIGSNDDPSKRFMESKILMVDSNFFSFFSFRLLEGDSRRALSRPFTMVISERASRKYFGRVDPVGKLLKYDGEHVFEITGVAENPPSNSSIDFDFLGSASSRMGDGAVQASSGGVALGDYTTFLLVKDVHHLPALEKLAGTLMDNSGGKLKGGKFVMNELARRYTSKDSTANMRYRKIFPLVAGLILLLALINYMSLATARSTIRAKEIGVRKVLGADRGKIIRQFYIESGLYAVLAFALALGLFSGLRHAFYNLLQLTIDDSFLWSYYAIGVFVGLLVVTIFVAGCYPSLVLSAYRPVKVLYGRMGKERAGGFVRKVFTVLQFSISVGLIIASLVINRQLYFFRHMDTGIQREQVLMVPYRQEAGRHYQELRDGVAQIPGVVGIAKAASPVYGPIDMGMGRVKGASVSQGVLMSEMYVDESFIKLLGLQWKVSPADEQVVGRTGTVILNEEAMNELGADVNRDVVVGRDTLRTVGVLKNFNYRSLHEKIGALALFVMKGTDSSWYVDNGDCLFIKTASGANIPNVLDGLRRVHDRVDKAAALEYEFLDEAFDAQYKAEDRLAKIFNVFTVITIFIACMGLFGLASFSAAQRTKEIGIRKVLGAGAGSIVGLIAGSFMRPVALAIVIGMPAAWVLMNKWLEDFAYRVDVGGWVFVVTAGMTMVIAVATVSFQAVRAAMARPVESLRTE
ncbi:MAG: ABC transporter permease [Bacteroidetes bacterium]|nr:ABC transporter permease [Bacteroidota bacterium]